MAATAEPLVTLVLAAIFLLNIGSREALGGALILCAGFAAVVSGNVRPVERNGGCG